MFPLDTPPERLLTVPQVASALGVHRATVYKLATAGTLPCVRIGESIRFRTDDLATLARSTRVRR